MRLIDKDTILAEIDKRKEQVATDDNGGFCSWADEQYWSILDSFQDYVNTLEVKEIDLNDNEKESLTQEYINYTFNRHNIDPDSKEGKLIYYAYMHGINACLKQFKARKINNIT